MKGKMKSKKMSKMQMAKKAMMMSEKEMEKHKKEMM